MGADLFIQSLYERQRARWARKFDAAIEHWDSLPAGSPERENAQRQADRCLAQMRSRGYFRDSYNDSALLWQFGLSWWNDVIPMLDGDSQLTVAAAKRLLAMLTEREDAFARRLSKLSEADALYFRDRYAKLRQFLDEAVALGEPIDCSL